MKGYSGADLSNALCDAGLREGDILFLTVRAYTLGKLHGAENADQFCRMYLNAIFDVIGQRGTLVVPTYSQQVARFGMPFIHEETPAITGVFSEFVRKQAGAVRSLHPVFSLAAIGGRARELMESVGTSGFGAESPYDRLFKTDGFCACLGFEFNEGHLVHGAHYIESTYGVPYFYNKLLDIEVFSEGKKIDSVFTLNVRYYDFDIKNSFERFLNRMRERGFVNQVPLGAGILYACKFKDQLREGYELLKEDVYAFLENAPKWRSGEIPSEGSIFKLSDEELASANWSGYTLNKRGSFRGIERGGLGQ